MEMSREFDGRFKDLTGHKPFPWQRRLYERMASKEPANVPASCNIPTGLGKTNVIAIWLVALISGACVPRRLVYVVNRRTVVDQTTDEVVKFRERLLTLDWVPPEFRDLALSTLRGQFADNREWSADPSRPAVICGTVDMIGSRLLFSGYGVGFKVRPLHAGFLGQDVLLVHDEAHLEPAFQELLLAVEKEQRRCKEFGTLRVVELTATPRKGGGSEESEPLGLTNEDYKNKVVRDRFEAKKSLKLIANADPKKLAEQIVELALEYRDSKRAILIFVRRVEDVEKITAKLAKEKQQFKQLTGTLRGLERDELVNDPIFLRFLKPAGESSETAYLVCTSAGEVGVNISADHLVCDLSTFDSMAQRFGRVNRFGDFHDTEICVNYPAQFDEKLDLDIRLEKTLMLLTRLDGDASPKALTELPIESRTEAVAPLPKILSVSDILLDSWAMTTIRGKLPGRPPVEPYLHGISEWQPPETQVAWREEVEVVIGELLDRYAPEDLLEDFPLKPHELLKDRSDRVFKHLEAIAQAHPDKPAWLTDDLGTVEVLSIGELANKNQKDRINHCTILLPPSAGGLESGRLNGEAIAGASDVSTELYDDDAKTIRRRIRVWNDDPQLNTKTFGMRLIRPPIVIPLDSDDGDEEEQRTWGWYSRPLDADDDLSNTVADAVSWDRHTNDVVLHVRRILKALELPIELQRALILATQFHDLGKKREIWQRSIGNPNPSDWYAKSGKDASGQEWQPRDICRNYRHEFGSALDLLDTTQPYLNELERLESDHVGMKDLVLHLIAAHHGYARPHFPLENAYDLVHPVEAESAFAAETPRRFARLQRRYGRWGLAYLESLLRAADWAASSKPSPCEALEEAMP
jgi:CRISPR-associated endonuclease/helicase Cas3